MLTSPVQGALLLAGATGALGQEVLRQCAARGAVQVLARAAAAGAPRRLGLLPIDGEDPDQWPPAPAPLAHAVVLFERPRPGEPRDALAWSPSPGQLPALARWLRRNGCTDLALVLPHAQGRLPEALKHGLASLDEQLVAGLGFERLLILRTARRPDDISGLSPPEKLAAAMLSIFKYMVPSHEQPEQPATVASFLLAALALAPPGIHVAAPELLWRAARGDPQAVVRDWLRLG